MSVDLHLGNCLEVVPGIVAPPVDAKPNRAVVLFGSQPFTSALVSSNLIACASAQVNLFAEPERLATPAAQTADLSEEVSR